MGILYFLTDEVGEHIMTAPLTTIKHIFHLHPDAVRRIEIETKTLEGRCELSFLPRDYHVKWSRVEVRRLPEEIPA